MKTYLIHHIPRTPAQDTWAVSFSLPYIADSYARAGDGLWYVKTWLTAAQIKKRLAILFDDSDELRIHELGREEASINAPLHWLDGRLEHDEPITSTPMFTTPRAAWASFQVAVSHLAAPLSSGVTAPRSKSLPAV